MNPATGEAEMRYHIEFLAGGGRRFTFDGTKYMQKDVGDLLQDYTTLYCHVTEQLADGARETGIGVPEVPHVRESGGRAALAGFLLVPGDAEPVIRSFSSRRACASSRSPHSSCSANTIRWVRWFSQIEASISRVGCRFRRVYSARLCPVP